MTTRLLIARSLAFAICSFAPKVLAQTTITYIDIRDGSAYENAAAATVIVERGGNTNTVVSVDYATNDGSAKAGIDYAAVTGTLAFSAGETEKRIFIPLADDDGLVDGDKTFRVCLTNATGGAVIETSEGIVTILDNEVPANLDYSFNPVIEYDGEVLSFATLPDGKLVIGGYFTRVNGAERSGLACLNADGSLASAFQTSDFAGGGVYKITPLPDGRIYIAGNFDSVNGVERLGFARLLPDGALDPSFAATDFLNYSWEIVQTDGKIIASTSSGGLVRLNLDGQRDNGFVPTPLANWTIYALAEHTDGKLLVWGADGQGDRFIRLNTDGSLDNSFGSVYFSGDGRQILVQPDKKILLAGTFYSTNGIPLTNLERLNADGSFDTGFHAETIEAYAYVVTLAEDGKIIVLSGYPPTARRLNTDGSLDSTFPGFHITVHYDLAGYVASVKSIGAVAYVYGNFLFINGARVYSLGRILLDAPPRTGMDIQPDNTRGWN